MVVRNDVVVWKDLDSELSLGSKGDIYTPVNIEAVYAAIDNIFSTPVGSRVMLRSFGSSLRSLLAEPLFAEELTQIILKNIKIDIARWDSRIAVDNLNIQIDRDNDQVTLQLSIYIRGYEGIFKYNKIFKV